MKKQKTGKTTTTKLINPERERSSEVKRVEKSNQSKMELGKLTARQLKRLNKQIDDSKKSEYTWNCKNRIDFSDPEQYVLQSTRQETNGYQSLRQILHKERNNRSQKGLLIDQMKKISMAFAYFHKKEIAHNNINLGNIYFKQRNIKIVPPKLKFVDKIERKLLVLNRQRFDDFANIYESPEMREGEVCSTVSDVWALGVVFLQICINKDLENQKRTFAENKFSKYYQLIKNQNVANLIAQMLERRKKKRITLNKVFQKLVQFQKQELSTDFWNSNMVCIPEQPLARTMKVRMIVEDPAMNMNHFFRNSPLLLGKTDEWFSVACGNESKLIIRLMKSCQILVLFVALPEIPHIRLYCIINSDTLKKIVFKGCEFEGVLNLTRELLKTSDFELIQTGELMVYFKVRISCEKIAELLADCKLNSINCSRNIVSVEKNSSGQIKSKAVLVHPRVLLTTANATIDRSVSKLRLLPDYLNSKIQFPKQSCEMNHIKESKYNFSLILTENQNDKFGIIDYIKNYDEKKMMSKTQIRFTYLIGQIKFKIGEIKFDGRGGFSLMVYKSGVEKLVEGQPLIICFGITMIVICGIYTGQESGFIFINYNEQFIKFMMLQKQFLKISKIQQNILIFHEMDCYNRSMMNFCMNNIALNQILQSLDLDEVIDSLQKSKKHQKELAMVYHFHINKGIQNIQDKRQYNQYIQIIIKLFDRNSIYSKMVFLKLSILHKLYEFYQEYQQLIKMIINQEQQNQSNFLLLMLCYRQISQYYQSITLIQQSAVYKKKALELYEKVNRNSFISNRLEQKQRKPILVIKKQQNQPLPVPNKEISRPVFISQYKKNKSQINKNVVKDNTVSLKNKLEEETALKLFKQIQLHLNNNFIKCLQVIDQLFKIINKDQFFGSQLKRASIIIWKRLFLQVYRESFLIEEVLLMIQVGSKNWLLTEEQINALRRKLTNIMKDCMFIN